MDRRELEEGAKRLGVTQAGKDGVKSEDAWGTRAADSDTVEAAVACRERCRNWEGGRRRPSIPTFVGWLSNVPHAHDRKMLRHVVWIGCKASVAQMAREKVKQTIENTPPQTFQKCDEDWEVRGEGGSRDRSIGNKHF